MSLGEGPRGFSLLDSKGESQPVSGVAAAEVVVAAAAASTGKAGAKGPQVDPIESLFFRSVQGVPRSASSSSSSSRALSRSNSSSSGVQRVSRARVPSSTMAGVSPSGDSITATSSTRGSSGASRNGTRAFMRAESSCDPPRGSSSISTTIIENEHSHIRHAAAAPTPISRHHNKQQQQRQTGEEVVESEEGMDQYNLGPVDQLLLLVEDGQSLSRRVLGNERQSARLGERLSALKNPLWQLQARVRTQAERPPEFVFTLTEQVSHCLDVLLELTHPDWWNQIRRKVRRAERQTLGRYRKQQSTAE